MTDRRRISWPLLALGAACAVAITAAILLVGPAPASQTTVNRTAAVALGVVQSTVSGTGNLQPASQLDLGFKTSGTVTRIYVHTGQQVASGQLLAALDPQSAEVTLQQARASLQSAKASLASAEETGASSSGQSSGAGSSSGASPATAGAADVALSPATTSTAEKPTTPQARAPAIGATTTPVTTAPSTSAPSTTAPAASSPATTPRKAPGAKSTSSTSSEGKNSSTPSSSSGSTGASTISPATREANIASAKAAMRSDKLTVQSDERAVSDTRLVAPQDGTIASLSGQVGEVVSGGGTTRAASGESSASTSTSSTRGAGATSSSSASPTSSSSGSGFAVLSDLSSMRLVVPLSESEISSVHDGQIATVTVEALEGRKLAAHVGEVAILSTSNSGVVSYDVTFDLDQMDSALKPGMSATAEVVVKQAQGLNVPSSAISGGSVTVLSGAKREARSVTTGLAGNSSTIVLSGLKAGETVALPSASTTPSSGGAASGLRGLLRGIGGPGGGAFPGGAAGVGPRVGG